MKRLLQHPLSDHHSRRCFHRQRAGTNCAAPKKWSPTSRSHSMWAKQPARPASTRSLCLTRLRIEKSFRYEALTVDASAMIQTNAVIGNMSDDAKLVFRTLWRSLFLRAGADGRRVDELRGGASPKRERAQKAALPKPRKQSVVVIVAE